MKASGEIEATKFDGALKEMLIRQACIGNGQEYRRGQLRWYG